MRRKGDGIIILAVPLLLLLLLLAGWMIQKQIEAGQQKDYAAGVEMAESKAAKTGRADEVEKGSAYETSGDKTGVSKADETEGESDLCESAGTDGEEFDGTAEPREPVLLFAGDVYLSEHVLNAYEKAGGISGVLDEEIRQEITEADIFMVNQEFPFTSRGTAAADKQFTFRLPPEKVSIFQEMGIDIVTLANNHILDFGTEGLLDSCQVLREAGIAYVGGGRDREQAEKLELLQAGEKTIGFLGVSRVYMDASWAAGPEHPGVFSTYDPARAVEAIGKASQQCDYLVVYVHWGIERKTMPEEYQRAMGRQYIDAGADLVVGSHPHVLQEIEYYGGKPIVYSLGNFVFGSSIPSTALLKVVLREEGAEISMLPCTSAGGYTRMNRE